MGSISRCWVAAIAAVMLSSCRPDYKQQTEPYALRSVLNADVGKVSLNMSKDQVLEIRGWSPSIVSTKEAGVEILEYEKMTVMLRAGKVSQVVGSESLQVGGRTYPVNIPVQDLAAALALDEASLRSAGSGPTSRSITANDGSLTLGLAKGRVLSYGLQVP